MASQRRLLSCHITPHVVYGYFALFSDALATKISIFKVKMVKGGKKTKHQKKKKRKKVAFCASESPG